MRSTLPQHQTSLTGRGGVSPHIIDKKPRASARGGLHITSLDSIRPLVAQAPSEAKRKRSIKYVDVRVQITEGVGSWSEDGAPKASSQDWGFSLGVRVIAAKGIAASGYYGRLLGVSDFLHFPQVLLSAIDAASQRALANSLHKERFAQLMPLGQSVTPTELARIDIHQAIVEAVFAIDPRNITPDFFSNFVCEAGLRAKRSHPSIKKVEVSASSVISRQLFSSSEGAFIDQSSCSTGGTVFVLAQNASGNRPVDLYHHTGNQLGFEALSLGKNAHKMTLSQFARQIADEANTLSEAKPAPSKDKPVVVVLDPDLVALFAHEIIGHPAELDRAIKMETGYAGRSWFFTDLQKSMVGKKIGSPLLTAFSDPTLRGGYGHYLYDDEGTPAKRVYHINKGIFQDFLNSRQTAAIVGAAPNGHYKANDASVVPLIRMSVSAIAPGKSNPASIISDVEHGYYCVGHRIPSISESRENFQIAPRLIYEIRHGRLGRVFRDGRVTANSKDFFNSIDAVGSDFTIFPIPNCGKGQPMQAKQVGNGGPTIRAQAMIARGV